MPKPAEYRCWLAMKDRCHNPNTMHWDRYGGRGIVVCDEWRESFESFVDHIGPRPSPKHSIDRIDCNRGYEPGNVRWATAVEQNRNRTNNIRLVVNGVSKTIYEWSDECGVPPNALRMRVARGWTPERAISVPFMKCYSPREKRREAE